MGTFTSNERCIACSVWPLQVLLSTDASFDALIVNIMGDELKRRRLPDVWRGSIRRADNAAVRTPPTPGRKHADVHLIGQNTDLLLGNGLPVLDGHSRVVSRFA